MSAQSQAYPEMIDLISRLKARYNLKVVAVSNEGRELAAYRNEKFGLKSFIDFLIRMLNFLSLKGAPLSRLIRPLKKYQSTGEINLQVKDKEAIFAALEAEFKDARIDHLDGLTVEYDAWRLNLRASNMDPVMRLNLEANDSSTEEKKKNEVLIIMAEADPSMTILL